jgi:hypothetical protein
MLTLQPMSVLELALEGEGVCLDLEKFIFPEGLSGFQERQGGKWENK